MQNDSQRLITFIVLSGLILFGFNMFFGPKKTSEPAQEAVPAESAAVTPQKTGVKPETTAVKEPAVKKKPAAIRNLPEKTYTIENALVKAVFSSIGGVIISYQLKEYTDSSLKEEDKKFLELIPNKASYSYMSLYSPSAALDNKTWRYEGTSEEDSAVSISFSVEPAKNIKIIRTYRLNKGSYLVNQEFRFVNRTTAAFAFKDLQLLWGPNIHFLPADVNKHKDGFYQFNKVAYPVAATKKVKQVNIDLKAKESKTIFIEEKPEWIFMKDLYFTSSFVFSDLNKIRNSFIKTGQGGFAYLGVNFADIFVNPGSESTIKIDSYIGPQEYKRLKKLKMDKAIDLGWIRILSVWMFYAMDFFHKITRNYGLSIILLTILIRGLLWIPSQKSYKQMKETQQKMNIIKPRMETLKKVYKNDPQKLNEETMKLYKEYKINPFGGCLPMLLQLPIFIAFYQTLINMVELKGASFVFWMQDLSRPDPFYILPLFMGISMFIQQKMSQTPSPTADAASQQKIMLYGLPIFLTFLAFKWPSGLLLYWGMSNVLAIIQQFFVNKSKS